MRPRCSVLASLTQTELPTGRGFWVQPNMALIHLPGTVDGRARYEHAEPTSWLAAARAGSASALLPKGACAMHLPSCPALKTPGWAKVLRKCPPRPDAGARLVPRVLPATGG